MPSYSPPGGITQAQLDSTKIESRIIVRREADLPPLENGVHKLADNTEYYFDSDTEEIEIAQPIVLPRYNPLLNNSNIGFITSTVWIKWVGAGALFQNPDDDILAGMIINALIIGDATNTLFDVKYSSFFTGSGLSIYRSIVEDFADLGTIRNCKLLSIQDCRFSNFGNKLKLYDNDQVKILGGFDATSLISNDSFYEIGGKYELLTVGLNPQALFFDANQYYLRINPFSNYTSISVRGVIMSQYGTSISSGRLFLPGLSRSGVTISNNGSGNCRINNGVAHNLSNLDSIRLSGLNPYAKRGYKVEVINTTTFDLLADINDILSFEDGGVGLTLVTTDYKHWLSNGDTIIISSSLLYNGTYVVSGVDFQTPSNFKITKVFAGNDTGQYKKYVPFTTAGDTARWYSGSLNETTPGLDSEGNSKETNSTAVIVVQFSDAGPTAVNATTWKPLLVTATLQPDGEQRFEVASDGKIYYTGKRRISVMINTSIYGQLSTGTETDILFSYLVNAETTPRASTNIDGTTWKNVNRGKNILAIITLNEGDYINPPAAKTVAGSFNLTIQPSRCFVKQ